MGLEISTVALDETTFVRKVPPYIQTYLGQNVLAPLAPDESTILTIDQARQCAEAGGTPSRHAPSGCYFAPAGNGGNGNGNGGFQVETWMYVAGGVGVLGLLWFVMK